MTSHMGNLLALLKNRVYRVGISNNNNNNNNNNNHLFQVPIDIIGFSLYQGKFKIFKILNKLFI